ncbi:related to RNA binding motif protein [Sporisorium reilianum f. sp. reilianum]|uniref:Related to RNA binding motif protein n=1 Tax=Sporisorium reilianum f. sp. reilianum TaxID=72559 RepID=A0A2N8UCZ3_9BASI|nr:related to RNA binding motif protein [Sporisorium reilianum f. sp. reilianum]
MTQPPTDSGHGLSARPSQEVNGRHNPHQPRGSTHKHAAPSSQAWSPSSSTSSTPQNRDYVDRDDPRYASNRREEWRHRDQLKRRSRSPEANRDSVAHPARPVAWKDLRTPTRVDQSDSTSEASSSKTSTLKSATTAATKRFASDISRWNRKQSELQSSCTIANSVTPADPKASAESDSSAAKQLTDAELASYDYKDRERVACLLCQRKFKSLDTLHRHEAESQLHKDNLASLDVCRQAVARMLESAADQTPRSEHSHVGAASTADPTQASAPTYRDRASERRAVFGADTPSKHNDADSRTKVFDGPTATVSTSSKIEALPQSALEKPIDSDNVGSKLLAMMGWSQGQGLGAQRKGRTDIIETKVYRPGAGLGSSGAESAAQAGSGQASAVAFAGYADRAKHRK